GYSIRPRATAPAVRVHLTLTAPAPERRALTDASEQVRGGPEIGEAGAAESPREDRQIRARCHVAVRPNPHVVRACRAPAGPAGIDPDRRRLGVPRGHIRLVALLKDGLVVMRR